MQSNIAIYFVLFYGKYDFYAFYLQAINYKFLIKYKSNYNRKHDEQKYWHIFA
jgi:hypothetical protein